jgi:hypothetical protein
MEEEKSILQKAHDIVYERSEEKSRMYGEFTEGMEQTARIASELSRKEITTFDAYNVLLALKLSRASWNYKEDNYLDLLAYAASLNDYLKDKKNQEIIKPNNNETRK